MAAKEFMVAGWGEEALTSEDALWDVLSASQLCGDDKILKKSDNIDGTVNVIRGEQR